MVDAALDLGILERRGSWYAYGGGQLAQGRLKVIEYLKENEIGLQIEDEVRNALAGFGKDDEPENVIVGDDDDDKIIGTPESDDSNSVENILM